MFLSIKRIIKFGWQDFWRNKALSFQAVLIFSVAVFIVTLFFLANSASNILIAEVQKKFDISVYFQAEIEESAILKAREELLGSSLSIQRVDYVSKDEALATFLEKHQNDPLYKDALNEIESNPFLASLNVKAGDLENYDAVASFLEQASFKALIERISYNQNKQVIDRMFAITKKINFSGVVLAILLGMLVFFMTFNTVRLLIHSSRDEIATMKLVGASKWFIQGPLLFQGFLYAIFAFLVVDLTFFGFIMAFKNQIASWFFNFDLMSYFVSHLWIFVLGQLIIAGSLGAISTLLASRKYLKT